MKVLHGTAAFDELQSAQRVGILNDACTATRILTRMGYVFAA